MDDPKSATANAAVPTALPGVAWSALDSLPAPLWWADADGRLLYANRAAWEAWGRFPQEVAALNAADLYPGFPSRRHPETWARLQARGSLTFEAERQGAGAEGRRALLEVTVRHCTWDGLEYVSALARDVTEERRTERELREREERLRVIFDTSRAAILLVDAGGAITFANRRAAQMFGWPLEQFIGSTYPSHVHPSEREPGDARMRRLIAGELDHVSIERRYVRADGTDFWGYLTGRRHVDAEGNLVSLVGVIADITERKQAEEALRASQERYRGLIALAADAILHGDPNGRIIGANLSATALTGYGAEELMQLESIAGLFSEEERQRVPLRYDLLREGKTVRSERLLTRKDGSTVPIEMNTRMMPDGTFQTVIRDMSERKQAEDVLRASEEKFAKAFNRAPVLIAMSALEDGRYLEVNDTFCEVSGFSREEAVGHTSVELGWIAPPDRQRLVAQLRERGRVTDLELALTAKDGRRVHCLYSGEVITVDGAPRLLSIAVDVTEQARLREDLFKAQRLESLGVLAGGLAHDFNNILTGILGNLSLARVLVGGEHSASRRLGECEKAAVRAADLTRQLLTFARGGAPVRKIVEAAALVEEAVSFALGGSNVRGLTELPPDLWRLHADEGQLSQVLHNLLLNAKQAMPSGGTVTVRGSNVCLDTPRAGPLPPGRYVRIEVRDTGTGIPPDVIGRVFDPYFTTKPGGTGLGLSSVYSIVRRHGGDVRVSSSPGEETVFVVHLPAAGEECHRPAAAPPEHPAPCQSRGRVLVMDDEEMIRELATGMLEALGYTALACPDGAAAVDAYRQAREAGTPFDAVLLDLTVPGGMGGKETAAQLLAIDPQALLIVSSGYSNDPAVAEHRAAGFAGAVVKPYSLDRLSQELLRLLRAHPARSPG
ncbi:MAG: PAS domain S-box protein [Thermodesulfobacteriota bacterium]